MKKLFLAWALVPLATLCTLAQQSIYGIVSDSAAQKPLSGAFVILTPGLHGALTSSDGKYSFKSLKPGSYSLKISYLGYKTASKVLTIETSDQEFNFPLPGTGLRSEEVMVTATRVSESAPIAHTDVDKKELNARNLGQDLPFLLGFTPSVVVTSDAGTGIGYTGIRIRGSDASRTSVTINGIPYNDAESQGTYFVDLPDFASSLQSVQIQRGVGTSTNGAGALGASINLQTENQHTEPYAEVNNSFGSFNTRKNTFKVGTGLINNRWAFDGRLSQIQSAGYIDRSGADLKSFYTSGTYFGKKSMLKLLFFSGKEITHQAWYGTDSATLETNRKANFYTYPNQVDNYQQDHYQLHYNTAITSRWDLNAALHYTSGYGFFEEYVPGDYYSSYGLKAPTDSLKAPDGTVKPPSDTATFIRRRWLDNRFYGTTFSAVYKGEKTNFILGGAINRYEGDHFGEVIWASHNAPSANYRYYNDKGIKDDQSFYCKLNTLIIGGLSGYLDMQYRYVRHHLDGIASNTTSLGTVSVDRYNYFLNPKAGLNYMIGNTTNIYVSYAIGNKEPNRQDYIQGALDSLGRTPKPEQLQDLELGFRWQNSNLQFGANYYYMKYKDQLVNNGGYSADGTPLRINVPNSYRTGLELEASLKISDVLNWGINATFSQNRIKEFTETIPNYNTGGNFDSTYKNVPISISPSLIGGSRLTWSPFKGFSVGLLNKYVGKQYLDLSGNENSILKDYFISDVRLNYTFATFLTKEVSITLLVNNVFDVKYSSNGYSYRYYSGTAPVVGNYYYPQAGINFLAGLNVRF